MAPRQAADLAFPREEFDARLQKTRQGLVSRGQDAGIFFAAESIYYLSGYDAPSHYAFQLLVVPVDRDPFIVLRQHVASNFWATSWLDQCVTLHDGADPIHVTRLALTDHKLEAARLGLEEVAPPLTVQTVRALASALPNARFSDCSGIIEALRLVKSPREIDYMRRSAELADIGMETARAGVAAGVSEAEIAAEASRQMILAGSDYQIMPVVLGIEERSRLAIPFWTSRRLRSGESLWVEVFAGVRRYSAGLKTTLGARPASQEREQRAATVLRALQRAIDAVAPGRPASSVAEAVHETFRDAGYGEYPHHQSGYSMGIAFSPAHVEMGLLGLRRGNAMPLAEGMTLHPIANLYGSGPTIAASHMVLVTAAGAEVLTRFKHSVADLSR